MTATVTKNYTITTAEQMQAELSSLPLDEDIPTPRERDRVAERRQNLSWRLTMVRNNERVIAKYEPEFIALTKWVADLTRLREVIAAKLLYVKRNDPEISPLRYSLMKIDRGFDPYDALPVRFTIDDLLVAAGYEPGTWYGTLPWALRRLEELTKRRAAAVKEREQALREYAATE